MAFFKMGGLWLKKDRKKGAAYLIGAIFTEQGKMPLAVFENKKKEAENDPDYIVFKQIIDKKR